VSTFARRIRGPQLAAVALVMFCVVAVAGRANGLPPGPSPVRVGAVPGGTGQTSVLGAAWRVDNTPIAGAHVQLRNLVNGKVQAAAVANEAGRFTFSRIEGGSYVVELLGENGKVASVGHAFVIAPGETVATFVRLGTKVPWFSGFFSNAASIVASSAASQGITAMAPVQLTESR
jgi:hypothetical protein